MVYYFNVHLTRHFITCPRWVKVIHVNKRLWRLKRIPIQSFIQQLSQPNMQESKNLPQYWTFLKGNLVHVLRASHAFQYVEHFPRPLRGLWQWNQISTAMMNNNILQLTKLYNLWQRNQHWKQDKYVCKRSRSGLTFYRVFGTKDRRNVCITLRPWYVCNGVTTKCNDLNAKKRYKIDIYRELRVLVTIHTWKVKRNFDSIIPTICIGRHQHNYNKTNRIIFIHVKIV